MRKPILVLLIALLLSLTATAVLAQDDVEITMWHIQTTEPFPEMFDEVAAQYESDNPNVSIEVVPMQNDPYKQRIRTAIGAGDEPCIFPSWGGGPMLEYVNAGTIIPLTDYFQNAEVPYYEGEDYTNFFLPASFSNVTAPDGEIYGFPVENVAVAGIWYNKAIFEEYGLEVPTTLEELNQVAATLIENDIAPFSLAGASKWTSSMYYMYLVDRLAGPETFAAAAAREGSFEAEPFVRAGEIIQEWVEMGAFVEGFNGLDYDLGQSRIPLYSGQAAMQLMGSWSASIIKSENEEFYNNNLGFFPFPAIEGGAGDPTAVVGTVGDNYYHISANCENPDVAFDFLTYLLSDAQVEARIAAGRIPPIVGVAEMAAQDEIAEQVLQTVENANSVQLWYDQYLPVELGEVHKDTMQALFGLAITPEEAAAAQEAAAAEFFGS